MGVVADMNTKEKVRSLKEARSYTTEELSTISGVPIGTINRILSSEDANPTGKTLAKLAKALGTTVEYLYGDTPANILPITTMRVPLLGTIACGEPIYADEDRESYVTVGTDIHCDFALRCKGDSMINARIHDGDIVFIRKQDTVSDGEIAAVILDDEATLKRFRRLPGGMSMLEAENPAYPPVFIGGESETRSVRILGKAVAFQGDVR